MLGLRLSNYHTRVIQGMKENLQVWNTFLRFFNGVSFWREDMQLKAKLRVHSDAADGSGFGVFFHWHWCAEE